jgi:hypothetical protein
MFEKVKEMWHCYLNLKPEPEVKSVMVDSKAKEMSKILKTRKVKAKITLEKIKRGSEAKTEETS